MELFNLYLYGIFGLLFGEVLVLYWFVVRLVEVIRGEVEFEISKKVPLFYLIYAIPLGIAVLIAENGFIMDIGYIPLAQRISNAFLFYALVNLTTPLYPLLWWLRKIKIKTMRKSVTNKPVNVTPQEND